MRVALLLGILAVAPALAAPPPCRVEARGPAAPARPGETFEVRFDVAVEPGWHVFAPSSPPAGGTPFSVTPDAANPFPSAGPLKGPAPTVHQDPYVGRQETYEGTVTLTLGFSVPAGTAPGTYTLKGTAGGQACNPSMCVDPDPVPWEIRVTVEAGAAREAPVPAAAGDARSALGKGPLAFLLAAFAWGLATLLTPCVYPMVPVTIAYFSKQEKTGRAALGLAGVYTLGIVALFTLIGVGASLLMKGGVVAFGNSPWVNLLVGVIFVVFALSLFGAFELALPSGLLQRVSGGRREGYAGALFLGFVFAVTSFACTAPFAGSVLAIGVQSRDWLWPVVGMVGFSSALAIPFFFLAAFPGMLRALPRSGGWMETVKHVCAFVELGAALKFLGAADITLLDADFLTRPVVIGLWAALSLATGLYLLGAWRFPGEGNEGSGVVRILSGTAFLALGLYFASGLSGARLGPWEAFLTVPDGKSAPKTFASELPWIHGDLDAALETAKRKGVRVLTDFSAPT